MQLVDGQPVYSATDLVGFLACPHLTDLERSVLAGLTDRPMRPDPELDRIRIRGFEHERRYRAELEAQGRGVTDLSDGPDPWGAERGERYRQRAQRTREAMARGDDVIYQACFFDGTWLGFADFLLRVERPTGALPWSYEVADTKLARSVKASALLQVCSYSEQLARVQGGDSELTHIVLGGSSRETVSFRLADYAAYFRTVKRLFERTVAAAPPTVFPPPAPSYPDPVEHCDVCRWWPVCTARRRGDDDLSIVAGMPGRTRAELKERAVPTRRALAVLPLPLRPRLERTGDPALERVHEQARIQVEGEEAGQIRHERLAPTRTEDGELDTSKGLLVLPEPRPGDLFLDLEGDPFAFDEGIDYLFGILEPGLPDADGEPTFHRFWARDGEGRVTLEAEARAFERAMDLIVDRLAHDPAIHVFHYASYEPTALGRLMGRHATRQVEVERLMRGDTLVDLFGAVRQGIRASVESYSIKRLEPLYGYDREVDLRDAGSSIVAFETWLETGGEAGSDDETLLRIERYNRDDVVSTWMLRDWLEDQRRELGEELGMPLPRPVPGDGIESEKVAAWLAQVREVADPLVADVPEDPLARTPEQQARWLLAQLLGWHRREQRPAWWRYFHLLNDLTDEERLEEREPLALLDLVGVVDEERRTYRYRFPPQEHDVGTRGAVDPATGKGVTVESIDDDAAEVVIRFPGKKEIVHPRSLVPHTVVASDAQEKSLLRIGQAVLDQGMEGDGAYRAARDLLLRRPPRVRGHASTEPLHPPGLTGEEAARDLVMRLDRTSLAIQGPPGTGKTWTGARMILDLVADGKRVGVTANSHKVIGKVLDDTWAAARDHQRFGRAAAPRAVRLGQRYGDDGEPTCSHAEGFDDHAKLRQAMADGEVDVVGGTAWLWARPEFADSVDVLFVDEAGQFSLANAVAVSQACASLVLLGDPQQLDQPTQGTHPPGAERSALAHLLGNASVMPAHLGLFMERTWRLHPEICAYTSEAFYDGQLRPEPGNERQGLHGRGFLDGTGIRFVAVDHEHARDDTDSPAEAEAVADMVEDLLAGGAAWTDRDGDERPVGPTDIIVVAPYNLHRRRIGLALQARGERPARVPVGTVDKFQGQQAPIAIYSMASSTPEDAPRGLDFLYSRHRLNVATSRARCLSVVVCSPALVRVRARTPRQMRLANALCRFVEMAAGG